MNAHMTMKTAPAAADRTAIAGTIDRLETADTAFLSMMMSNPAEDEALIDGLHLFLDRCAAASFLHTMKLEKRGLWFGETAPARLQIRLAEAARSSQHAAHQAFRAGLTRSGGLERAFPKA